MTLTETQVVAVLALLGAAFAAALQFLSSRRSTAATVTQQLIDQLQEEIATARTEAREARQESAKLRAEVIALRAEFVTMQETLGIARRVRRKLTALLVDALGLLVDVLPLLAPADRLRVQHRVESMRDDLDALPPE